MHASQSDLEDHHHHPPPPPPPLRPHPPPENGFVTPEAPSPGLMLSRVDGCVLPFLGGFGRYQKQLVVLTWIPALFIGFSQFSDYFLLAQPNSTCLRTSNGTRAPEHESTTAMTSSMISSMISPMSSPMSSSAPFPPHALHTEVEMNGSQRSLEHCACENETLTHELLSGLKQNVVTKVLFSLFH
ncbi:solute carrier family 22 member 23-like [Silurus asotus]|uniref:Solute carrier family 22 member 23-like n=1 Tax=Silurus asotus TaxID=30991 RepID=A0AAD5FEN4_SILAS|nr:solute carrier family 22 member 23-like [Silurus asotus]